MEYESNRSYIEKRSAGMAIASMILGIVGVVLGWCVYPGLIFGSLAIIFALLSRGGEMTTSGFGRAGLILGIIAFAIGVLMFIFAMSLTLSQYGGWNGYMNSVDDMMEEMYPDYPDMYDTF